MEKYLKRSVDSSKCSNEENSQKKHPRVEFNPDDIISDPGLRRPINEFDISIRYQIRCEYLTRGPCQPFGHSYPRKQFGKEYRSFQDAWFKKFSWLEYSISKDAAFCFWCYLFTSHRGCRVREDVFTNSGISNWKKAMEKFNTHVGGVASAHNDARAQFEAFQNQQLSVSRLLEAQELMFTRLTTALDVTRFLLKQGLPFYGHDESLNSLNEGNFVELIEWYSQRSDEVAKTMSDNAPGNNQITSPTIQKELIRACAYEVTNVILNDIGDNIFSLMVDECRDSSVKEQMGVVLRYMNKHGCVIERFLAVVYVSDTSAISLKKAIDELFVKHKLSLSRLRGQGYDGASSMRDEYNGLKALILKENSSARHVHCFSHQLQLVVVAVAKSNRIVSDFFQYVAMIVNIVGDSCRPLEGLEKEAIVSGKGMNQEINLRQPRDTHWGSHYMTIVRLMSSWISVLQVLENVYDDGTNDDSRGMAASLIDKMESYQFVFVMHFMKYLLGITNELSLALQQKDQNMLLTVSLIKTMKVRLQTFSEEGWEKHLDIVNTFCNNHMIPVPNMEENIRIRGRSRRNGQMITNFHHYRIAIFCEVLDRMIEEMNNRFSESNMEVFTCIASLDPKDSFFQFDIGKLLHLAELYPEDFSLADRIILENQLETYIQNVRDEFSMIEDLGSLAKKMVETGKNIVFSLVYRLIELALVLPVTIASVERVSSAIEMIKTDSRVKMSDEWKNDNLIVHIEKEIFASIGNEQILQHFQPMNSTCSTQLVPLICSSKLSIDRSSSVN